MRRNRRPGFLADPHDLDDHELFDADLALYGIFKKLCHWAAHGDYTDPETGQPLRRGEVLTSERQIAEKFGISRIVVSRCLRVLQANGFINRPVDRPANRPVGSIIIISNYDTLFSKKKRNRPANRPVNRPVPENVPLYVSKQNLHTQDAGAGVCATSNDEGKQAEPSQPPVESPFLDHPLVIEWNGAASEFRHEKVSEATPGRLRAMEAAMRDRSDLSWWRAVFGQACRRPIKMHGSPWRPSFEQCLDLDRAARYYEASQRVSHLKPVPNFEEKKIGPDSSRGGSLGHVPERPIELRQIVEPGRLTRTFRGLQESGAVCKADATDSEQPS